MTKIRPIRSLSGTFCWHSQEMPAIFPPPQAGLMLRECNLGAAQQPPGPPCGKIVLKKTAKMEESNAERDYALLTSFEA